MRPGWCLTWYFSRVASAWVRHRPGWLLQTAATDGRPAFGPSHPGAGGMAPLQHQRHSWRNGAQPGPSERGRSPRRRRRGPPAQKEGSRRPARHGSPPALTDRGADRAPVTGRYGVTRQAVHVWLGKYQKEGLAGLADHSHRPHFQPRQLAADVEAMICQLRGAHPRWGLTECQARSNPPGATRCPAPLNGSGTGSASCSRNCFIQKP